MGEKEMQELETIKTTEEVDEDSSNKDVKIQDSTEVDEEDTEEVEDGKTVPYNRFKEVNDKYKALKAELGEIKSELNKSQAEQEANDIEVDKNEESKETDPTEAKESVSEAETELKQYKEAFRQIFEARLNSVPEQFRDLIPEGTELFKLQWIDNAFDKGLFEVKQVQDFGNKGSNPKEEEQQSNTAFIKSLGRKF